MSARYSYAAYPSARTPIAARIPGCSEEATPGFEPEATVSFAAFLSFADALGFAALALATFAEAGFLVFGLAVDPEDFFGFAAGVDVAGTLTVTTFACPGVGVVVHCHVDPYKIHAAFSSAVS
jgi:hypothetical protein